MLFVTGFDGTFKGFVFSGMCSVEYLLSTVPYRIWFSITISLEFKSAYAAIVDNSLLYTTICVPLSFSASKYISPLSCTGWAYLALIVGGGGNEKAFCGKLDLERFEELPLLFAVEIRVLVVSVKTGTTSISLSSTIPVLARSMAVLVFSVDRAFTKDDKLSSENMPYGPTTWDKKLGLEACIFVEIIVLLFILAVIVEVDAIDGTVVGTETIGALLSVESRSGEISSD